MLSIKNQYKQLQEGNMSQANFLRNVRMSLPHYVTNLNNFDSTIKILKNKGILNENDIKETDIYGVAGNPEEEAEMKSMDLKNYNIDTEQLKQGTEVEMEHTNDPKVAERIAMDHLKEDPEYYIKLKSIGLEENEGNDVIISLQKAIDKIKADPNALILDGNGIPLTLKELEYMLDRETNKLQEANPGIDPTTEEDYKPLTSSKSDYEVINSDGEVALLKDKNGDRFVFWYDDNKKEIEPYSSNGDSIDDMAIQHYINDNSYGLSKGVGMADYEAGKDLVKVDDDLKDNFSDLFSVDENQEELSDKMKHIQKSMGKMDSKPITPERRAELEKLIAAKKAKQKVNESKEQKGGTSGKELYSHFKEMDLVNSQELLIGIDWEMQKSFSLSKKDAAKKAIKNIKKIPNYYTMLCLSGVEGAEPQYYNKDVKPEDHQMKPFSADKTVDKGLGMKPVKGFNKEKASSNKAHKETNKGVAGVEEMTHKAVRARGIKGVMDMTGGHMKKIREHYDTRNQDEASNWDWDNISLEDAQSLFDYHENTGMLPDDLTPEKFEEICAKYNLVPDREDDIDPAGGYGLHSHLEETVNKALAQSRIEETVKRLNETVKFSEIKDLLTKISQENDLFIYNKEVDINQLKDVLNKEKGILPKKGIIAVDSLTDTDYVFVVSKDENINNKVNQSINQSEEFSSFSTRTDKLQDGILLTLLTPTKKIQEITGAYGGDAMSAEDGSSYINDRTEIEAKAKDLLSNEAYRAETGWNENELNEFLNSFTNEDIEHDYQAFVVGGLNEEKEPLYTQDIFEHPEASHVIDSNDQNVLERYFEEEQDGEDIPNLVGLTSLEAAKEIGPVDFEEETLQHIIVALNPDKFEPFY